MRTGRRMARGRSEATPARLLLTVIALVAVVVGAIWLVLLLLQALA